MTIAGTSLDSVAAGKRARETDTEALADSQKKALMTRKQRKMYEGLRKREDAKAERIATLERKRDAAKAADAQS